MSDTTINLSADASALIDALSSIAQQMSGVQDGVSSATEAMQSGFDTSAQQAEATNAAIHGLDSSVQSVTGAINEQTNAVNKQGAEQTKVSKEISKALETQAEQQKSANEKLDEQNKKLKAQEEQLKKVTKQTNTWGKVLQGFAIKFASDAVDMFKNLISTGLDAAKVYEDMSAKIMPMVGDLDVAKATFWSLNALEDETAISTDKLAKSFIDLGNSGLTNSNEQLKVYATIAQGTGRDLNTLTDAVIKFSQGSVKALRQFGITAVDNGSTVSLTYKGMTTEIEKNSKALDAYLSDLAKNNFDGVLDTKLNTVSAATGRLTNAWGTFATRIMQSNGGFGELIILGNDLLANTLNGISAWLDDPAVFEWFHSVTKEAKLAIQGIKDGWSSLSTFCADIMDAIGIEVNSGTNNWKLFFSNFFKFCQIGLLEVAKLVRNVWDNTVGVLDAFKTALGSAFTGGDFVKAYKAQREATKKEGEQFEKEIRLTQRSIENEITDSQRRIEEQRKKLAEKLSAANVGGGTQPEGGVNFSPSKASGGSGKHSSGGNRTASEARDTWTPYYEQLLAMDMQSKSSLQKLEKEHFDRIQEYQNVIAENAAISETEKNNALLIIETNYQEERKRLEQEASEFIRGLNPEEEEMMRLENEYQQKLDKLNQFHEDQLISEQTFLERRDELRNGFEKDKEKLTQKQKSKKNSFFSEEELENVELFKSGMMDLSDAFGSLTTGMNENSSSYKALFAIQKSFAIASATMNAIVAWTKALSGSSNWYEALANYASAIALTAGIISQLKSITMHDKGGRIPAGGIGIVGEYGPELIQGPASITSRRETADLARSALSGGGDVIVNLYESSDRAGTVETSEEDDTRIINIFVSDIRRGGEMSTAIQNTFNLKRIGA